MGSLMYGSGLRLMECAELHVKAVHLDRGELTVRDGKGGKDRVTMAPVSVVSVARAHLEKVRARYQADLAAGHGGVALPGALTRKLPGASLDMLGPGDPQT